LFEEAFRLLDTVFAIRAVFLAGHKSVRWPRSASSSGVKPTGAALARISPRSLMLMALVNTHPEPGGMSSFKSSIDPPLSQTKACRLLWQSLEVPTTWPSVLITLIVVAVWFSQSVMPYRIPGAVDYSDYPGFQILHVEKRGLQFHETCVTVGEGEMRYRWRGGRFSVTTHDRRLFAYRFSETDTTSTLTSSVYDRIHAIAPAVGSPRERSEVVKPVRAWNADNWYLHLQGSMKIYGTSNGTHPPQEIVDLFHDLQALPQSARTSSELRDVCLGFCYDPLSAMGYLFANHRCFNDGRGLVCR
jgi:hypothetical protein